MPGHCSISQQVARRTAALWCGLVATGTFATVSTIRVPTERQGQTGMGQGGFTCHEFVEAIGEPVTVALRSPIPLDVDLDIVHQEDRWHLVNPSAPDTVILEATRWTPDYASTAPVSIEAAAQAREAFPMTAETHPAPHCYSCGIHDRSLRVHAGPMPDGRWATPLRLPESSLVDGRVDMSLVWMAVDCSCGWYISGSSAAQARAVTVQFAVDVIAPVQVDTDYALVSWHGDYSPDWDGRKRGAAAALFDASGSLVASSRSFWVAPK